jgi:hypothetical protein
MVWLPNPDGRQLIHKLENFFDHQSYPEGGQVIVGGIQAQYEKNGNGIRRADLK